MGPMINDTLQGLIEEDTDNTNITLSKGQDEWIAQNDLIDGI